MDKKKLARMEMLKRLSKSKPDISSSLGEALKGKKLSKVEVVSDSPEGLKKGLSKAEQILKAKLGDKAEDSEEESSEEEVCPVCEGAGCPECEAEESSEEESEE